jgi:hypothetical protein
MSAIGIISNTKDLSPSVLAMAGGIKKKHITAMKINKTAKRYFMYPPKLKII